ncbi:MAG: hypothetical protein HDT18_10415 [Oscillibacter sp.]|nr:hypothetical protein [Oscillibacter sp.]
MRKMQVGSLLVLSAALAVMAVGRFAVPLPDWAVRTAGVAMLLALACTSYSIVRRNKEK